MSMKKIYTKHCDTVHTFATEVIEKRRKQFEEQQEEKIDVSLNKKKYLDFIDILLAVKVEITLLQLNRHRDIFLTGWRR